MYINPVLDAVNTQMRRRRLIPDRGAAEITLPIPWDVMAITSPLPAGLWVS
jgi:hypothetical protein